MTLDRRPGRRTEQRSSSVFGLIKEMLIRNAGKPVDVSIGDKHAFTASIQADDDGPFLQIENMHPDYAEGIIGDLPATEHIGGIWRYRVTAEDVPPEE